MGSLLLLRSLGRKVNSESLRVPRDQPEKEREGEGERERERERKLTRRARFPRNQFEKLV